MANNCFVTKLKGTVDNPSLPKYGYVYLGFSNAQSVNGNIGAFPQIANGETIAIIEGDGQFYTNSSRTTPLGKELKMGESGMYGEIFCSNDTVGIYISKYNLKFFQPNGNLVITNPILPSELKYCQNLSNIATSARNAFGEDVNINDFGDSLLNRLTQSFTINANTVSGSLLQLTTITSLTFGKNGVGTFLDVTGDISLMTNLKSIACQGVTYINPLQYKLSRPADAKICVCLGLVNFGADVDAFLIDMARLIPNSPASGYTYPVFELGGTRTSASDSAVAALKAAGYSITLIGTTL